MNIETKADSLIQAFATWCEKRPWVKAVALVGSYARGDYREDSDIDFVIIVDDKGRALQALRTTSDFGPIRESNIEEWGQLTSLRVYYSNGPEVEYGVVTDGWVKEPVDNGTEQVVRNGFEIVLDKRHIFRSIEALLANER